MACTCGLLVTTAALGSLIGGSGDTTGLATDGEADDAPDLVAGWFDAAPAAREVEIARDAARPQAPGFTEPVAVTEESERNWWDEEPEPEVDPRVRQMEAAIGLFALFAGADVGGGGGYSSSGSDWHDDMAYQRQKEMEYESSQRSSYNDSPSMFQSSPVWDGAYAPSSGWNEASPVWQGAYAPSY
jgi:hypothetical protein